MVCFQAKNPNLGKFRRALDCKMLIYFMAIWNILRTFKIFMTIWYILCSFGTLFPVLVPWTKKNLASLIGIIFGVRSGHLFYFALPLCQSVNLNIIFFSASSSALRIGETEGRFSTVGRGETMWHAVPRPPAALRGVF
jgi:hypothetical protein